MHCTQFWPMPIEKISISLQFYRLIHHTMLSSGPFLSLFQRIRIQITIQLNKFPTYASQRIVHIIRWISKFLVFAKERSIALRTNRWNILNRNTKVPILQSLRIQRECMQSFQWTPVSCSIKRTAVSN